jgi:hypothetical protein
MANFEALQGLLIRYVSLRIRNGEYTERQLARLIGTSQPQLHNVLKGARPLKQGLADALLRHFQIGLLDLLGKGDGAETRLSEEKPPDYADKPQRARILTTVSKKRAAWEERLPASRRRAG